MKDFSNAGLGGGGEGGGEELTIAVEIFSRFNEHYGMGLFLRKIIFKDHGIVFLFYTGLGFLYCLYR